jgi:hypothetical protein
MVELNKDDIIKALYYIAEDNRNMKSFKFNDFIHIYQRPTIMSRQDVKVDGYDKWCIKHQFFLSCFGVNISLFHYWEGDCEFDEYHANKIINLINDMLQEIKSKFF